MQSSLFQQSNNLLPKDGDVQLLAEKIMCDISRLKLGIEWKHEKIFIFGKWVLQPRLTAWYGDEGTDFVYSGLNNTPLPWNDVLLDIKQQLESVCGVDFNSVLLNYYRNGQDSMGWHQDNEPEFGKNPLIASLSLGEARRFQLRHKVDKSLPKVECALGNGDVLLMSGQTQDYWQHQIPKTRKPVGERINLTFRNVIT